MLLKLADAFLDDGDVDLVAAVEDHAVQVIKVGPQLELLDLLELDFVDVVYELYILVLVLDLVDDVVELRVGLLFGN